MALPVSKSALDRLGVKLAASDAISDDDLTELARIVHAYQDILNGVKERLTGLGYSATTRMKTTGTLVDKLRRETARLSQVQDLAGARIVVPDRTTQDEATKRIGENFELTNCTWKVIDRRENPSHGYRAVHLVVQIDKIPVEIQIRTELQDSWAQLLERLADVWGRGIRYGQEPDAPETPLVADEESTRRNIVSALMTISDLIAQVETYRMSLTMISRALTLILLAADNVAGIDGAVDDWLRDNNIQEASLTDLDQFVTAIVGDTEVAPLFRDWRRMTVAQLADVLRQAHAVARRAHDRAETSLASAETTLRGSITQLASAIEQE